MGRCIKGPGPQRDEAGLLSSIGRRMGYAGKGEAENLAENPLSRSDYQGNPPYRQVLLCRRQEGWISERRYGERQDLYGTCRGASASENQQTNINPMPRPPGQEVDQGSGKHHFRLHLCQSQRERDGCAPGEQDCTGQAERDRDLGHR